MRILVCGGRDFTKGYKLFSYLDNYITSKGVDPSDVTIIEGGAKGADSFAKTFAKLYMTKHKQYPADWKTYPKSAGPIRNKQMINEGKPDVVIAFAGGKGTANMIEQAKKANIEVIEVLDTKKEVA